MQSNPALDQAMQSMFGVQSFQQVVLSPDGKRVAWVETQTGPDGASSANSVIYVAGLDAPTHSRRRITAGDGKSDFEEHDVAWSPDSQHIAFLSDAGSRGQLQLFIADIGGANLRQLIHLKGFLSNPAWSPDSKPSRFFLEVRYSQLTGYRFRHF
jgi:Tol biopolymer transport system component